MIRTDCFEVVEFHLSQNSLSIAQSVMLESKVKIFDYQTSDVLAEIHPPRAKATLPSSS